MRRTEIEFAGGARGHKKGRRAAGADAVRAGRRERRQRERQRAARRAAAPVVRSTERPIGAPIARSAAGAWSGARDGHWAMYWRGWRALDRRPPRLYGALRGFPLRPAHPIFASRRSSTVLV